MSGTGNSDFDFLVVCLKYTQNLPKPNFEQVAAEIGAKNANSAYHRHYQLMRKLGLSTSTKPTNDTPTTPSGGSAKKRGRPAKKKEVKKAEHDTETDKESDDVGDVATPRKKAKKDFNKPVGMFDQEQA